MAAAARQAQQKKKRKNAGHFGSAVSSAEIDIPEMFLHAPDDEITRVVLEKQTLNAQGLVSWGPRTAVLSQSYLTFYEIDDPSSEIDRIPLIEILKLSSKYIEDHADSPQEVNGSVRVLDELAGNPHEMTFLMRTMPGGANCGRNYTMCCAAAKDFYGWYGQLDDAIQRAKDTHSRMIIDAAIGNSAWGRFRYNLNEWFYLPLLFPALMLLSSIAMYVEYIH